MSPQPSPCVVRARRILGGGHTTAAEALDLVKCLQEERQFGYARKLLGRVRPTVPDTSPMRVELAQ